VRSKTRFAYPEGVRAYEDNYAEEAEYPKIDPETRHFTQGQLKRHNEYLNWQRSITEKPTVEEKLMELNVNRFVVPASVR
jgi:hypothetical protein